MPGVGVPQIGRLALRLGNAIVLVAAAFLLRQILVQYFGIALPPFITFYPAIMIVALLTGFWPGLLATTLSALLVAYWISPPMGKWTILSVSDAVNLALFIGTGVLMSGVAERYRRDHVRLAVFGQEQVLLRLFIEHAPVALAMFDSQMRYLYASQRWLVDYGLGDRDLRGLSHYDVFPEISAEWKDAHRRGLAGEVIRKEADRFERADGTLQWVRWELRPWNDAAGKVGGIVIFTEDISERKNAEEAMQESQDKLQGIVGSAMDAIISVNEQQRIVVFNRAAEKIFGCVASEAIGTTLDRFIPAALRAGHSEHIRRFGLEGVTTRSMTSPAILTALRTGGEEFPIEATISHVQAGGEKLFTVILRDITERKRAENKLRWSEDQLRALAARSQTASERERLRIARELHDQLGLALTSMKMDLNWILRKHEKGENNWIPMVQDSIKAVDSTIALVRRLATELRPRMLDTAGLAPAIEWHVAEFQRHTGIFCTAQVSEDTFGFSSDQRIEVFRICQEALTNVARHSRAKHVLVTLAREQDQAILTVNDDGVGFLVDELVNTPALGIVGMRERAVLLSAQLHIESAPANGSTITLRVPLEAAQDSEQETH
jgi:PAS domain S-box-containing protein